MRVQRVFATALFVVLMAFGWWAGARLVAAQRSERHATRTALARDSAEAAEDTSRALPLMEPFGDSLHAVERRAVQAEQRADALDRALGRERVARAQLTAHVAGLTATVPSETVFVVAEEGARRAAFDLRSEPYTVHADVSLPPPPASGRMDVRVELDTLGLEVRVGCGARGESGVRPASVTVVGPAWASVRLGRVEQSPSVCNDVARATEHRRWAFVRGVVDRFGVVVGYAAARAGGDGKVVAGPAVGVGVRVWP